MNIKIFNIHTNSARILFSDPPNLLGSRVFTDAQKIKRVGMAALGAAVGAVSDAFISLVDAAQMFIKGDFKGAIDKVATSFGGLGNEIAKDVKGAIELERVMNGIKLAERELISERAKSNKEIANARMIADDLTKSTEERIEAIKRAGEIEERVASKEQDIAKLRLKTLEQQADLNETSEEAFLEMEQARARVFELERETIMRQKRLGSEVQSLKNEQAAKDKERDAARLEAIKERDAAEVEAAKKKAAEIEEALKAQYANELRLAQEAADGKLKSDEYLAERRAKTAEEQLELEIERALRAEDEKFNAVMEALFAQDASKAEYMEAQRLYEEEQMAIENELRYAFDQEKLAQAQATADEEARINKEKNEKIKAQERELREAKVGAARATAGALGQISALIEQQQGEATAASKAFAIAQVLIDTATSISSAIAGATEAAAAGGPAAPFLLVTYIATMVGSVVGAIASATSILDSVPGGGSASGAVAGVASATSAPSVQPVTTNTTQLNNTEQAELQPIQAYVVETAITGSQGNVTQIESQATFGGG